MLGTLELTRTNPAHIGVSPIEDVTRLNKLAGKSAVGESVPIKKGAFETYLMEAVSSLNEQQNAVGDVQRKLITDPDSVDVHDITISMAKAQMSLSLAQSVADRIIKGWAEITTTR